MPSQGQGRCCLLRLLRRPSKCQGRHLNVGMTLKRRRQNQELVALLYCAKMRMSEVCAIDLQDLLPQSPYFDSPRAVMRTRSRQGKTVD